MRGIADYAVVYDITSDAERRRVNKILKGFGFGIQKSVFECRMNKKWKDDLIEVLKKLDIQTGFVKVYRLEYSSQNCVIGKTEDTDVDNGCVFIV